MIEWLIFLAKLRNKEKKIIIQNPVLSQKAVHYREQFNRDSTSCIIQERNSEMLSSLFVFSHSPP